MAPRPSFQVVVSEGLRVRLGTCFPSDVSQNEPRPVLGTPELLRVCVSAVALSLLSPPVKELFIFKMLRSRQANVSSNRQQVSPGLSGFVKRQLSHQGALGHQGHRDRAPALPAAGSTLPLAARKGHPWASQKQRLSVPPSPSSSLSSSPSLPCLPRWDTHPVGTGTCLSHSSVLTPHGNASASADAHVLGAGASARLVHAARCSPGCVHLGTL